jgi:WD40 repeat protein
MFHHSYKIDANFYKFFIIERLKMLSVIFILWMLFGAHLSGKKLQRQDLLRSERLYPESQRFLQELAKQQANLTPPQRKKLIKHAHFLIVLVSRFCSSKSQDQRQTRIPIFARRYFMTLGIPRQMPGITQLAFPRISYLFLQEFFDSSTPGSVLLDNQGIQWTSQSKCENYGCAIKHMTVHPSKPYYANIDKWGNVWIGRTDNPDHMLIRIHDGNLKHGMHHATLSFFSSKERILAVVINPGKVVFYKFTESLDSMVCRLEVICSSMTKKFWISGIKFHPFKPILTIICNFNEDTLLKTVLFNSNFEVICEDQLLLPLQDPAFCSYFLPNGDTMLTGHSDGKISFWRVDHTESSVSVNIMNINIKVLPDGCHIEKIEASRFDPTIFGIFADQSGLTIVYIVKISSDRSSIEIIQQFPADIFFFYRDLLLVSSGAMIELHLFRSNNTLVKVLEFQSQIGNIQSCVLITENGKTLVRYSIVDSPAQHTLELSGSSEIRKFF